MIMKRQRPETAPRRKSSALRPPAAVQSLRDAAPVPDIRWRARLPARSQCKGRTANSTHQATSEIFRYTRNLPCIAKLAGRGHTILKERLTPRPGTAACAWRAYLRSPEIVRKFDGAWHIQR